MGWWESEAGDRKWVLLLLVLQRDLEDKVEAFERAIVGLGRPFLSRSKIAESRERKRKVRAL